jgi:membrane fusion protein (multidrug efflux system)
MATQSIEAQKASLKASKTNYERNKILKDKGVVSVQMYEFTEEGFMKDTVALQNAYDRQTQSTVQVADQKNKWNSPVRTSSPRKTK